MRSSMQNLTIEFNNTGVVQVRGDIEDAPFLNRLAPAISALDQAITTLKYKPDVSPDVIPAERQLFVDTVLELKIPKAQLAARAGVSVNRVADYLKGRDMPNDKIRAIERAVEHIAKVWTVLPVRVDLTDERGFAIAVQIVDNAIAKVAEEDTQDLRVRAVVG